MQPMKKLKNTKTTEKSSANKIKQDGTKSTSQKTIDDLSNKTLIAIFSFLTSKDLLQIMLVNKRFKNLVQKTESLNDKLVLHLRKSWLDCPIKCAALDEMLEDEREFKRVHIVGSQDRFYSMDYEAFISKSVVSVVLSNAVASLSELKKFFNQLPEVQLVKFVENKVLNLEELDPSEDDEDEYEDYDEDEDDEEYIEHHIRAKVPEIINWPYPVFNKLKKFTILSSTNWSGMEDQSQLFKHARNVENIATDARDLNFLCNKTKLNTLHLIEAKRVQLNDFCSNFLKDSLIYSLPCSLKSFSWSMKESYMTPKQAQNLKQFLSRQLRMQFMKLHTKKIDVFLPNIKIMKNLTYLDIIVYKMSLPTKFENASVTILKIAFSEIENWTFAAAFKFVQSFSKVSDLNVQIVLQDQMKLESPAEPITLETMKCLKEVALAFKCFKNNHEGKKMMKDIMQLIKIKQLQIFKIGPIDRVSNSESRITDSDWRAFCKKNPAIIHLVIRCYKPFYIKDDESLLRKYLRNLKCLQTSLNVSVCIGCPLLCVCQHRSEKYAANFLEHYQY